MALPPEAVQVQARQLSARLAVVVQGCFAGYIRLLSSVLRDNPRPAGQILDKPGLQREFTVSLGVALQQARSLVQQAWQAGGGAPSSPLLDVLQGDVVTALSDLDGQIAGIVREQLGTPAPDPAGRIAEAVRDAVTGAVTRARLSLEQAASYSRTEAVIAEGHAMQASGEHVMKMWQSKLSPKTCYWCRQLHGQVIPLEDEFPHGDPVIMPQSRTRHVATPAGARHYDRALGQPIIFTHPPRPWLGRLPGPLRHPHCECWLVIVTEEAMPPSLAGTPEPGASAPFVRASDIAALPEPVFHGHLAFLRAAAHELGQLLRRLKGLG